MDIVKSKILISLSGGQDSATVLLMALNTFDEVSAVSFNYGERNVKELDYAKRIAEELKIGYEVLDARFISTLNTNCYLTNNADEIVFETGKKMKDIEKSSAIISEEGITNTFVPGRNLFFLSMLAVKAYSKGYSYIGIGVNDADLNGYPDCRPEFIKSARTTINLALGKDDAIKIWAPLQYMKKVEIWEQADKLGKLDWIEKNTLSCYNGVEGKGCGECPSCIHRNESLQQYKNLRGIK